MDRKTWLICVIAAIGFAFDTYELLMLPLIARPALMDLLKRAGDRPVDQPVGRATCSTAGGLRRHLRAARRLPDRSSRAGGGC